MCFWSPIFGRNPFRLVGLSRVITQGCVELLGPMGISHEHLLEKWMRDCRITDIYEGTGEIQRLIIARGLFDYTRADLS